MEKKIYLSNSDKKIAGVCGGIAEYFDLDSTLVRLAWIFFAVFGGTGIIAYIIAAIIMPNPSYSNHSSVESHLESMDVENHNHSGESNDKNRLLFGLLLIFIGITFCIKNFFPHFPWHWFRFRYLFKNFWPVILILLGFTTIIQGRK